jgi:TPR repeat protein
MYKRVFAALAFGWACLASPAIAQTTDSNSLATLKESCNAGNAEACRAASAAVLESDPRLARSLAERGCAANDRNSCNGLGMMLISGEQTERDYARAVPLLAAACDDGVGLACGALSNMLLVGAGTAKDNPQALARAERGCTLNDARSCASLGLYLSAGDIFPRDLTRAAPALLKACAASAPEACSILQDAAADAVQGKDPRFDKAGALPLFEAACAGGQAKSCGAFGAFVDEGLFGRADPARAAVAYEQGCTLGNAMSCASLAEAYRNGRGVARNKEQARAFAQKAIAIEPANADAQKTLKRLN